MNLRPHPEERALRQRTCAVRCARLEGWPRVHILFPSFETLASQAPQDEVRIRSQALKSGVSKERRAPGAACRDRALDCARGFHPVTLHCNKPAAVPRRIDFPPLDSLASIRAAVI